MAQLTIDLAEFDKVRNTIVEKDQVIEDKEKEITKLNIALASLEKEARVVVITKEVVAKNFSLLTYDPGILYNRFIHLIRQNNGRPYNGPYAIEPEIKNIIDNNIKINNSIPTDLKTTKDYINLGDVKEELKKEVEAEVIDDIARLKIQVRDKESDIALLKADYEKKINSLYAVQKDAIDNLNRQLSIALSDKEEKSIITSLEEHIKELEDQYIKVVDQLRQEENKKWYQKLFN